MPNQVILAWRALMADTEGTPATLTGFLADRLVRQHRAAKRLLGADYQSVRDWYFKAYAWVLALSALTGHRIETVAAVTATLSPQKKWEKNMAEADSMLKGRPCLPNGHKFFASKAMLATCESLMLGDFSEFERRLLKTRKFALNLSGHWNPVTLDIWACRHTFGLLRNCPDVFLSTKEGRAAYAATEAAFQLAAKRLRLEPCQLQAILWVAAREYGWDYMQCQ